MVLTLACALGFASGARAEREGPATLLKDLIDGIAPADREDSALEARQTRDGSEALRLRGALQSRFGREREGVESALWIGLYYYGVGQEEEALAYFERARRHAADPDLLARASFWCEQARMRTGHEPLGAEESEPGVGVWATLRRLVGVDRAIASGRRGQAEEGVLALEGEMRRAGILGLGLARWGEILQLPGTGRLARSEIAPMIRACAALPERLHAPAISSGPLTEPGGWAVQFGAFLERENAEGQVAELARLGLEVGIEETRQGGRVWYRTRIGGIDGRDAADSVAAAATERTGRACEVVRAP